MSDFRGWPDLESNYFRVPNQLMDFWSGIKSLSEERVILYVMRHTWGFHDKDKRITLDEFQNGRKRKDGTRLDGGTGMSKSAILRGIKAAVQHGFLEVEVDNSDLARIRHTYSLCVAGDEDGDEDGQRYRNETPEVSKRDRCGSETGPRTEKETSERTLRQQPPAEEAEEAAVSGDDVVVSSSFQEEEEDRKPEVGGNGNKVNTPAGAEADLAQLWRDKLPGLAPLTDLRTWSKTFTAEWTAQAIDEAAWRIAAARLDATGKTDTVRNPVGYVTNVLKRWRENGGPTPAPRVNGLAWKAEADAAWELVERQIRRGGYQLVKADPTLWAVIQDMGGWARFMETPPGQWHWVRKELDRHYRALAVARQQQPA